MFDLNIIFILILFGCLSGFFAGLLGAGGGMITVPALFFALKLYGYSNDLLMHIAVGTSLAIIFPTSIISSYTHYKNGNLDKNFFKFCGVFIFLGIILGTFFTSNVNTLNLLFIFASYTFISGVFLLFKKVKLNRYKNEISNPYKIIYGLITGFLSVPLGIGGASIMVPIMRFYNYSIKIAIGTSAHFGIIISFTGFLSMLISGHYSAKVDEPYTLGYINILSFLIFVPATLLMARIGAITTSKIKKEMLDKIYGITLIIISLRAFYEIYNFSN